MSEDIEQGDTEEEAEAPEGRSGKKMGLIIIIIVVLLGGGVGGAYFFGLLDGLLGKGEHAEEQGEEGEPAEVDEQGNPVQAKITYHTLPQFLINLSSASNQTSFIKITVVLKLPSEADAAVVIEREVELQNEFNTYLRDLRASDLAGSAGMYRLQEELLARANRIIAPDARVDKILFTEILIQ